MKKFKKFIIAKRFKTKHFKSNSRNKFFSIKCYQFNRKVLVQRIPISANLFSSYNTEFYYKLNKYTTENLLIAKKKKSYFNIKKKKAINLSKKLSPTTLLEVAKSQNSPLKLIL